MTRFISSRKFSLDFLGEEWKECFINFNAISVKEMRELIEQNLGKKTPGEITDTSIEMLKVHFIDGVAYDFDSKTLVKLTKDNLVDLPSPYLEKAIVFLVGATV